LYYSHWTRLPAIQPQSMGHGESPNLIQGYVSSMLHYAGEKDTGIVAVYRRFTSGSQAVPRDCIASQMTSRGWRLFFDDADGVTEEWTLKFLRDHGAAEITGSRGGKVHVDAVSSDRDAVEAVIELASKWVTNKPASGRVHVLATVEGELQLVPLGTISGSFVPTNYSVDVRAAYARAAEELSCASPRGRLTIVDGPAGVGKSYLVRALAASVEQAKFVLVPSDMLTELGHPSLITTLLYRRDNCPIVILLEDADGALVRRMADNISSISALLNMADGILGELLDLRIVATTNAKKLDMEPAMLRDGRLSQRISVGPLSAEEATTALRAIDPNSTHVFVNETTLAAVYKVARGATASSATDDGAAVGFAPGR